MHSDSGVAARAAWLVAALWLATTQPLDASAQGYSHSGVVLPDLPAEVSPGEEIAFTPPGGTEGGVWTFSGVGSAACAADSDGTRSSPSPRSNLRCFRIAEGLKPGQPLLASYRTPTGITVIDQREIQGVRIVPARPIDPKPRITAAPELAIAGRSVCVCGNFPDARARTGLRIDGREVTAVSVSGRMALLPVDAASPPGPHVLSGSPDAGFSAQDVVRTTFIQVEAKLDANLKPGQSAEMEFTITGTDRPVALEVVNKSPTLLSMDGKEVQVLTSSGGSPNRVSQKVESLRRGSFSLDYSLAADRCPCRSE